MKKNISELGPKEAAFLSQVASLENHQFTIKSAIAFWSSAEKGWIARIERGKYFVIPLEAGPERQWSEDTYLIATASVHPAVIAYWSAIRHWNWTEQIPRIVYVQTTKRKSYRLREVFGVQYEFFTVNKRKFYGHVKEWRNGKSVLITDKEKTLVDCADDVERAGSIEELAKLHEYTTKFPNGAVKKRLGYLFEKLVLNLSPEMQNILINAVVG
ncbi:MAG: hypothetical protein ABIK27_09035 [Bacteroidota bacterium]